MTPRRRFLYLAAGAVALLAASRIAWAQAYPTRPVRIIAPTAPECGYCTHSTKRAGTQIAFSGRLVFRF